MQRTLQQDEQLAASAASSAMGLQSSPSRDELVAWVADLEMENAGPRANADRVGLVLDSATDYAIITFDMSGRITGWNVGAHCISGHAEHEVLGKSGTLLFNAEDRLAGVFFDHLWQAFETGSAPCERWHVRRDGSRFWASGTVMPLLDRSGLACGFLTVLRDATAAAQAREHGEFLLSEALHKAKNTFATVLAVVARHAGSASGRDPALDRKLVALARSYDLLDAEGAFLQALVERAIAPYERVPGAVWMTGPAVRLGGRTAAALNSVLHELATNAAKYGAFSVPDGRVEVGWETAAGAQGASDILILWREVGGPPVSPPVRRGFGTRVIETQLLQEGGTAELEFREHGVSCLLRLPCAAGA